MTSSSGQTSRSGSHGSSRSRPASSATSDRGLRNRTPAQTPSPPGPGAETVREPLGEPALHAPGRHHDDLLGEGVGQRIGEQVSQGVGERSVRSARCSWTVTGVDPSSGAAGQRRGGSGEGDEVGQPGDLGLEDLRPATAGDHHQLVLVQRAGGEQQVGPRLEVQALRGGDVTPAQSLGDGRRRGRGAMHEYDLVAVTPHPHPPVHPEDRRQHVDEAVRGVRAVLGHRLDGLEVEEEVAAGAVPRDPQDADALEAVARRDDAVGHHPRLGLDEDVVDGGPVAAVLDDLDRVDVAADSADGGRSAAGICPVLMRCRSV